MIFKFPKIKESFYKAQDFLLDNTKQGNLKSINGEITIKKVRKDYDHKYFLSPKLKDYVMKGGTKTFFKNLI